MIKKIGDLAIDKHWDKSNWSAITIIKRKVDEIIDDLNCANLKKRKQFLELECPYCKDRYWWEMKAVIKEMLKQLKEHKDD